MIGTAAGKLFGLNAATGEQQWFKNYPAQATLSFVPYGIGGRPLLSSPAVSGKTAYLGTAEGHFLAIDTDTGAELWSCDLHSPITSSAAISGNAVYIATYDGTVYAFVAKLPHPH